MCLKLKGLRFAIACWMLFFITFTYVCMQNHKARVHARCARVCMRMCVCVCECARALCMKACVCLSVCLCEQAQPHGSQQHLVHCHALACKGRCIKNRHTPQLRMLLPVIVCTHHMLPCTQSEVGREREREMERERESERVFV